MATGNQIKIVIAETAPIILRGLVDCLKEMKDFHPVIIEVDTKESLMTTVSSEMIQLLVVNPTFGGLLHPSEIRKASLNANLKIFAIEISKVSRSTLALYDDSVHVTEDLSELQKKVKGAIGSDKENADEKESLSGREKEIISYVVKGFTNQEIADKLFLSVHTVMTHRRNIARKLQIHSATGLTIYAIVNKIVDLSEIKL